MSRYYKRQTQYDWEEAFMVNRGEEQKTLAATVAAPRPPPPPPNPLQVAKQEIRRFIDQINKSIQDLYDLHFTCITTGEICPWIDMCHPSLDCRSHPHCMMRNLKIAYKIFWYHEKVQKEQEVRHEWKEEEVEKCCCFLRMYDQHCKRQTRTIRIVGEKQARVQELVDRLKPFITEHTSAILTQCRRLRTFDLVQSNQEAMTKIDLLEERMTRFVEEEKWYNSELNDVFRDIHFHMLQC